MTTFTGKPMPPGLSCRTVDCYEKLHKIDGVLSTRLIWTGSASEGPSNFYPAAVC